jgi:hypothetical protein
MHYTQPAPSSPRFTVCKTLFLIPAPFSLFLLPLRNLIAIFSSSPINSDGVYYRLYPRTRARQGRGGWLAGRRSGQPGRVGRFRGDDLGFDGLVGHQGQGRLHQRLLKSQSGVIHTSIILLGSIHPSMHLQDYYTHTFAELSRRVTNTNLEVSRLFKKTNTRYAHSKSIEHVVLQ